jgi:hypothetical protein
VSYNANVANEHTTPELIRSNRTSFSQAASNSPYTPPQDMSTFEGQDYNPDGIYGCDHDYVQTCEQTPAASPSLRPHSADITN